MYSENLQQIDRQIIELLEARIELLKVSENPSLQQQFSNCQSLLAQSELPEFVWQNLVTNCQAAATSRRATNSPPQTKPRRITVIGGEGMMGSFFAQKLSAAGHQITILEHHDWDKAEILLANKDLVLICVPIEYTTEVIQKTVKYISPHTALADITSIKAPVLKTMLEHHSGAVMGLHPMFGKVQSFLSQKIVVCPGRKQEAFQWLLELIAADGGELIYATPEEHDRMMVIVQAIRQFTSFSLGVFLAEQELDTRRSLDFASPPYRLQLGIMSRLLTQSAPMVVDIMLASPESRQAIEELANTYSRLARLIGETKREQLIAEFKAIKAYLAPQLDCCLAESSQVINALSTFVAASSSQSDSKFSSETIALDPNKQNSYFPDTSVKNYAQPNFQTN